MYKKLKQFIFKILLPLIRLIKLLRWNIYLINTDEIRIVVGAGSTNYKGWFSTDIYYLDITKEIDFKRYFLKKKIDKILAEHVLEHLTDIELDKMLKNFYKYSSDKINIRIAVPDGFHKDEEYIDTVKPGGTGEGADTHFSLFNYKSMSDLFKKYGFIPLLKEYWDEQGDFHHNILDLKDGYVERSFENDPRNKDGKPNYTSLIIDFMKQ